MTKQTYDQLLARADRCFFAGSPGDGSELRLMRELITRIKAKDYDKPEDLSKRVNDRVRQGESGFGKEAALPVLLDLLAVFEKKAAKWKPRK